MKRSIKDIESKGAEYRELLTLQLLDDILKELKKLNKKK